MSRERLRYLEAMVILFKPFLFIWSLLWELGVSRFFLVVL